MFTKKLTFLASFFLVLLFSYSCNTDKFDSNKNLLNHNDNTITGKILNAEGKNAAGVTVRLYSNLSNYDLKTPESLIQPIDSAITNAIGEYYLPILEAGSYIIDADGQEYGYARYDSLEISDKNLSISLPNVQLKKGGIIVGKVRLASGGIPRECYVVGLGTSGYALTDTNGLFKLKNLAQGTYTLRALTTDAGYSSKDTTGVIVVSDSITKLEQPLVLPYTGIPAPNTVFTKQDTLNGLIYVYWPKVKYPDISGYVIYRNVKNFPVPTQINKQIVSDTFYVDSLFKNQPHNTVSLQYRIKAHDSNLNISNSYSPAASITAPPPSSVTTYFTFNTFNTDKEFAVEPGKQISLIVHFRNQTRLNDTVKIYVDGIKLKSIYPRTLTGAETLSLSWPDYGEHFVKATSIDNGKSTWLSDSIKITVKPIWVFSGSSAKDVFPRSSFTVGLHDNKFWIIGGYGSKPGNPYDSEYKNDVYSSVDGASWTLVKDSARFSKRRAHSFLSYKNLMWVIGGRWSENWDVWSSTDGINWSNNSNLEGSENVSIVFKNKMWRIAGYGRDYVPTSDVYYSDGTGWVKTPATPRFEARMGMAAVVHDNKLWVIHGLGWAGLQCDDIWNSEDGLTWKKVEQKTSFPYRSYHAAISYNGKIWVMGGVNPRTYAGHGDIWCSSDGSTWKLVDKNSEIGGAILSTFVHNNSIYVCTGGTNESYTNIWHWPKHQTLSVERR